MCAPLIRDGLSIFPMIGACPVETLYRTICRSRSAWVRREHDRLVASDRSAIHGFDIVSHRLQLAAHEAE